MADQSFDTKRHLSLPPSLRTTNRSSEAVAPDNSPKGMTLATLVHPKPHDLAAGLGIVSNETGTLPFTNPNGISAENSSSAIRNARVEQDQSLREVARGSSPEISHRPLDIPTQDQEAVKSIVRRLRDGQETNVGTIEYRNGARWDGELDPRTLRASGWGTFTYPSDSKWLTFSGKVDSLVISVNGATSVAYGEGSVKYSPKGTAESGNLESYVHIRNSVSTERVLSQRA